MNPALSVVVFTTLAGAAQGLVLLLFGAELAGWAGDPAGRHWLGLGAALAVALAVAGLAASFLHLGRPERAWRAAAMWRTSWLSREVIVLPLFIAAVAAWGGAQALGLSYTLALGALAAALSLALFVCTAMIYISIRFIQEWAHPLTLLNYTLLGAASGATLACALAAWALPAQTGALLPWALGLTLAGGLTRGWSLRRNAALVPRSTLQTAIGVRHPKIRQLAMGFGGGSFNTREFFHGRSALALRQVKSAFLLLAFVLPAAALAALMTQAAPAPAWPGLVFAMQLLGLLAERWFFFAQANHPQNLYYQVVS